MGLTQDFAAEIAPADPAFWRAPAWKRRKYFDAAGIFILDEIARQLGKGVGRNGRTMKARIQPVLKDGADGPVMIPHYTLSRAITLADYMATDRGVKLFFHAGTGHREYRRALARFRQGKRKRPEPFGNILQFHAEGKVRGAPVRDVRLCKARIANVKRRLAPVWERLRGEGPGPGPKPAPKPPPKPPTNPFNPALRRPVPEAYPRPVPREVLDELLAPHAPTPRPTAPTAPPAPKAPGFLGRLLERAKAFLKDESGRGTPPPSKPVIEQKLGVKFTPAYQAQTRASVTVIVSVRALDAELQKETGRHVGPGGSGAAKPGSYAGFVAFLERARKEKIAVEMPRVALDTSGNPTVIDGRHRLAVWRDTGADFLPVSVPRAQSAAFRRKFGRLP